jgi:hypothetical protein
VLGTVDEPGGLRGTLNVVVVGIVGEKVGRGYGLDCKAATKDGWDLAFPVSMQTRQNPRTDVSRQNHDRSDKY